MAALYLHHAVFTDPPSPQPALRSPRLAPPHRHSSSLSSVTLHTSTSDYSHPTEPLLDTPSSASSTYLDLLARQPNYPHTGVGTVPLSLHGDPVTYSEQRSAWERMVRRRLRRLKWTRRATLLVIVAWAVYNTVRYFIAFTIYRFRERQIISLALGASTAAAVALMLASLLLTFFAPHLGWHRTPTALHVRAEKALRGLATLLVLAPAVINLVFTILWRDSPDVYTTLRGRCSWDIDVCWAGVGGECPASHSPSWADWLVGALLRLLVSLAFVIVYHLAVYQYDVTRRPRGKHRLFHPRIAPIALPLPPEPRPTPRAMASTASWPASVARVPSISATTEDHSTTTHESTQGLLASEPRALRKTHSRIATTPAAAGTFIGRELSWQPTARPVHPDDNSTSSGSFDGEDRVSGCEYEPYGRPVSRLSQNTYASLSGAGRDTDSKRDRTPRPSTSTTATALSYDESQLADFYHHFRNLVDQVRRETASGLELARDPSYTSSASATPSPPGSPMYVHEPQEHVPMVGRTVHRMPTIESLGSREVMSLASSGGGGRWPTSRPPTRAGLSDGSRTPSQRSRANSLDAVLVLTAADGSVSEMGELGHSDLSSGSGPGMTMTTTTTTTTTTATNTTTTGASSTSRSAQSWYSARTSPDDTRPHSEDR